MAQENSNSTMEMGTSDQGLVESKKGRSALKLVLSGAAVMIVCAVAITLVVVLSGNEGGSADAIVSTTTEGPTTVTTTTTQATTTEGTTTVAPPAGDIDLNSTIDGLFTPSSFDAIWSSEKDLFFRNEFGDLVLYDVTTDVSSVLVQNTSQILQQATRVTQLSSDGSQVILAHSVVPLFRYSFLARYTSVDVATGEEIDIIPNSGLRNEEAFLQNFVWGSTGTKLAYVYLNNIYYQSSLNATPIQITSNGLLNVVYNGVPDWVYEEEVFASNNAMWFSPSGENLAYATFDDTNVRVMKVPHYGVPGSVDYQYTQHHEIRYPKPGTTNPTVTVTLRDLDNGTANVYNAPTSLDQPILKTVRFATNDTIAVMWANRGQTSMVVVLCTLGQATCTQIFRYDEPQGWIDGNPLIFNKQGTSFLTILPQSVNGVRYKQVVEVSNVNNVWTAVDRTNTSHAVVEIMTWTDDDTIWYKATGIEEPAEQHVFSATSSGAVSCFTCAVRRPDGGECLYNDATASADASFITVNCAGPHIPQIYIFNSNLSLVRVWDENSDLIEMLADRRVPETIRMSVQLADGVPPADIQIQVPTGYESRTDVPLLINVYGGPDTAMVTRQWGIDWGTSLVSRWGVAVAHVDGRGAGSRDVDNMFQINRRLGSYEIDDQIAATRYLQQNLTWVDANRTCIWGWSYGGYAASLALARGADVFRCAAAVAPVVDWRFYDTIYTERYMDTPQNNPEGYANSSLLTDDVVAAYRNKNYFLIHGTADDNVHYQHAMLISRLLQRRDVYFTQMSYTDEDHSLNGVRRHLYHGLEKFLQENML